MTSIFVSAPGKVVLSGEYAVLRGAPAISMAIDRRAFVDLVETENGFHRVSTPGYAEGTWRFTANSADEISWLDEPPEEGLKLIEEAWRATGPGIQNFLSITLETAEFLAGDSTEKLGLGSSAAAMTALVYALGRLNPAQDNIDRLAGDAHKALQLGLGSGVDIATSFHGGVIEFRIGPDDTPVRRCWPDGLAYRFLWSGKPASTMSKIAGLDIAGGDARSWVSLLNAAEDAATAWSGGDTGQILDVFRRYTKTLRQFSIDHDLGIFDAGHDELTDMAAYGDLVYKPCGAGGGDIGIVMASENGNGSLMLDRFCEKAEAAGFQSLTISPDPRGVSVTTRDER